jgi:hypothetical protein
MGFVHWVGTTLFVIMGPVKEIRNSEGPQISKSSKVASHMGCYITPQRSGKNQSSLKKKRHIVYINHKFIFERQKKASYVHKA